MTLAVPVCLVIRVVQAAREMTDYPVSRVDRETLVWWEPLVFVVTTDYPDSRAPQEKVDYQDLPDLEETAVQLVLIYPDPMVMYL